jgi:putative ubiquitin-RnfH superfamily antitoxin RatB of RatAB toxin-antitoxin module
MTNTTILVKVGQIPGAINEYALEVGTTVAQALELAGLSATGYDVRLDGTSVSVDTVIPVDAKIIVLAKMIKGNADAIMVKVGQIPGAINEYALEVGTTVAKALELAGLSATGYDVRLDGTSVSVDAVIPVDAKIIVLAKMIKGNSDTVVLKVGVIPGAINEFAVEEGSTVGEVLALANLSATGYDVRLDGETVTVDDLIECDSKIIILAKQIKGNV